MQSVNFYQSHLKRVSRSFAFCIEELSSPMRLWTSLAYLLCRTLDTIEDSNWKDIAQQEKHYLEFESFIRLRPQPNQVQKWLLGFPTQIPEGEKALLQDAFLLFADLHELPEGVKTILQNSVIRMSQGMTYFSLHRKNGEILRIHSLMDVNRYCYFVAGIVGELLSKIYLEHRPDFKPSPQFIKNSFHFGLFLQKINLLKDQCNDEKENRHLVPNRQILLRSLNENIVGSIDYLTELPVNERPFRTFCGWSLFLGLASLPWIEESFTNQNQAKIPRTLTTELLNFVKEIVQDNDAIYKSIQEFLPKLPQLSATDRIDTSRESDDDHWFLKTSGQILNHSELKELRMID